MIILAIDPGPKKSGFIYWDTSANMPIDFAELPNDVLYARICTKDYDILTIENIRGYGIVAGDDTFDTCIWIGRFDYEHKAILISRKEIKRHLCGTTTTNDKYIRQALIDRFGEVGIKKNPGPLYGISGHIWSALAVCIVAMDLLKGMK